MRKLQVLHRGMLRFQQEAEPQDWAGVHCILAQGEPYEMLQPQVCPEIRKLLMCPIYLKDKIKRQWTVRLY